MNRQPNPIYEFGPFHLDAAEQLLLRDGAAVPLTPKAFDLLLALVERHGHLLEKDELLKKVWPDTFVEEANLASNISQLRKALGDGENGHRYIETAPKRGYRFVANVKKVEEEDTGQIIQEPPGMRSLTEGDVLTAGGVAEEAARRASKTEFLTRWIKRHNLVAALALAILLMLGAVLVFFSLRSPLPPKVLSYVPVTSDGLVKTSASTHFYSLSSLVSDGSRVYFTERTGGQSLLAQVSSTGGETVTIPLPFPSFSVLDISPSRAELLVAAPGYDLESTLWVAPVLGGPPRRLGDLIAHDAAWSPDGGQIVYAFGYDLYLAKSDGTQSRKLAPVAGRAYWPRWSPDSGRLRFTVQNPDTRATSLWEVSADGSDLLPLLPGWNNPAAECCGSWTTDGRYFVFQATHNQTTNIWALRERADLFQPASREPVQLTAGPLHFYAPLPSQDGRKLFVIGEQKRGELARYDGKTKQFVGYLSGMSAEGVEFSKDGEWIAYVTHPEGSLWRSRVDGNERLQLSVPPIRVILPRWSPDGRKIVFMGKEPGKPWKIYVVSASGGSVQQLMPEERYETDPTWSPDGNKLAFAIGTRASGNVAIHLLDVNTHQLSKLPGSDGLWSPRWSPDGRYICALPMMPQKLMLYDFTIQKWTQLTERGGGYQHWSRDGKYIYFGSPSQNDPGLFRVRIADQKLEQVVSLKGLRLAQGVMANWIGLALDDSPLVLRDVGTQDIYALELQTP
ncbi:MAG TPA: winged helix-turn-helix domain-containing protein [Blastocatellia bacterium]|jgi:Tol biopolymer transport system component/DNA-binding winged helix-turn-helix (wHTH) protein|nr:winged helix-turn-helix domain-containing protein [Blastocatellia bacterium]